MRLQRHEAEPECACGGLHRDAGATATLGDSAGDIDVALADRTWQHALRADGEECSGECALAASPGLALHHPLAAIGQLGDRGWTAAFAGSESYLPGRHVPAPYRHRWRREAAWRGVYEHAMHTTSSQRLHRPRGRRVHRDQPMR